MIPKELIPGLEFAAKHDLTQKEIETVIPFMVKPYTTEALAKKMKMNPSSLHHTIQRLKLKGLIILKERDNKGTNLNEFNMEILGK